MNVDIKRQGLLGKTGYIGAVAIAVIAVLLLYGSNLTGYWRGDDTAIISFMQGHALVDVFFTPAVWQELSPANLTPWMVASFYIDHALAGLSSTFYYAHHLAILVLLFIAIYALLALYMARTWALFGATTALLGLPVATVASQLMTRHYLEGLLFAVLCLYCFELARRRRRSWLYFLSALFYLLAAISKEIYVPVILVLALSWWGWLQQGLRRDIELKLAGSMPFIAVALAYVAWRGYMLPDLSGGYSDSSSWTTVAYWKQVLGTFATLPRLLLGSWAPAFTIIAVLLVGATAVIKPRLLLLAGWVAALVLLPLIPLVGYPGITTADRYLLLPWVVLCGFSAAMLAQLHLWLKPNMNTVLNVIAPAAVLAVVASVLVAQLVPVLRAIDLFNQQVDTQTRFAWDHGTDISFIPDSYVAQTSWLLQGLQKMKQRAQPGADIPQIILDDTWLDDNKPLYQYDPACTCMTDISHTIPARRTALLTQLRPDAPMNLQLMNQQGVFSWTLTPEDGGVWEVISADIGKLQIPARQGYLRSTIREEIAIQMKFTAAEGWISYSPVLTLLPDGTPLLWQRQAAATP